MRAFLLAATVLAAVSTAAPDVRAQGKGGDEASKRQKKKEWETPQARLEGERNAGPCPFVKVLYDASRYVELENARETAAAVKWSGEIQGVRADCRYREAQPITVDMDVAFNLGRGPRADGQTKQYRYWVAVTERNRAVIAKEYFTLDAEFQPGQDRLTATERLGGITIPRKDQNVSGGNFEILIGFDVTPEMAQFNRDGKRFRVNAGQTAAAQPGQTAAR
ncbi:MAG: Tat pathway signal sequence domain protein [Proteobacteria bacterium]|nr:Tat pathway signal sequence domain protein [Pseudomonadota bacterium]MBW3618115.1 Tat pathway signal sequence domain protein [Pseudomonadota bacterium]